MPASAQKFLRYAADLECRHTLWAQQNIDTLDVEGAEYPTGFKVDVEEILEKLRERQRRLLGEASRGFDLRLMSSLNDVSGIPTKGKDLIIVAAVNNVLHFRIFDGDGKVVVDTDEKRLTEQARRIEDLRKQLESLWPPHELTRSDKSRVITAVTSIVGHTPSR